MNQLEPTQQLNFFTAEELGCLRVLMNASSPVSEWLAVQVEDTEDPLFDIGLRSLFVRGLVQLDASNITIREDLKTVGSLLVEPDEAWLVSVEDEETVDQVVFTRRGESAIAILVGPPGVYQVQSMENELTHEVVGLVKGLAGTEGGDADPSWETAVAVQRLAPNREAPLPFFLSDAGGVYAVQGEQMLVVDPIAMEHHLSASAAA